MSQHYTVYPIDSAITGDEMQKIKMDGEDGIKFGEPNPEYKYLAIFPLGESNLPFPMASKDLKNWKICFAAYLCGCQIDLQSMMWEGNDD